MSKLAGVTGVTGFAVAGAVVVGVAAWFQFGPKGAVEVMPDTQDAVQTAMPAEDTTAAQKPAVEAAPAPTETASSAPAQTQAETPTSEATPQVDTAEVVPDPVAPSFDEVRQETDGMTVIAGKAVPGAAIKILQDGEEIATATADSAGKFAAIAFLEPDGQGHILSLVQTADAGDVPSKEQIILAPIAPVVVAQAATTPQAETQVAEVPVVETPVAETAAVETPVAETEAVETPVAETEAVETPVAETAAVETSVVETPTVETSTAETEITETVVATAEPVVTAVQETAPAPARTIQNETASEAAETVTAAAAPQEDAPAAAQPVEGAIADPAPTAPEPVAPQAVAVLKTTDQGVELLNTPRPEAMENVALDTISYSDAGDVQLAGRAQPDTRSVRVYLNNDAVISLPVDEAGRWRGDVPDVDEGIYTLRVDEVSLEGTVTSRVETPFKRESPAMLASAAAATEGPLKQITVQKGATLWAIAEQRYGDGLLYVNVFKANGASIRDPNLIYPGQVFELPADGN